MLHPNLPSTTDSVRLAQIKKSVVLVLSCIRFVHVNLTPKHLTVDKLSDLRYSREADDEDIYRVYNFCLKN